MVGFRVYKPLEVPAGPNTSSKIYVVGYWILQDGPLLTMTITGQIIATSHDLTPNGKVVREPPNKWPYFREI